MRERARVCVYLVSDAVFGAVRARVLSDAESYVCRVRGAVPCGRVSQLRVHCVWRCAALVCRFQALAFARVKIFIWSDRESWCGVECL